MQLKGFIQLKSIIIGVIAGVIVTGVVSAYITKTVNFGTVARLVITTPAGELGVKFYDEKGNEINSVNFGELREGEEKMSLVKIRNIGNVNTLIEVKGFNCNPRRFEIARPYSKNGLRYIVGVASPGSEFDFIGQGSSPSGYCELWRLKPNEEKKIWLFLEFMKQDTTGKTTEDINFNYEFRLVER